MQCCGRRPDWMQTNTRIFSRDNIYQITRAACKGQVDGKEEGKGRETDMLRTSSSATTAEATRAPAATAASSAHHGCCCGCCCCCCYSSRSVVPVLHEGRDKEGWVGGVMIEIWEERERGEGQPSEGGRRSRG